MSIEPVRPVDLSRVALVPQTAEESRDPAVEAARALKEGEIVIGGEVYFNLHWVAVKLLVAPYILVRMCRAGKFRGQMFGKTYVIHGESFHDYIKDGFFNDYKPRPGKRTRDPEADVQHAKQVLAHQRELYERDKDL